MTKQDTQTTISTTATMKYLGLSRATISRLVRTGQLKAYRATLAPNSPYRIYLDSVEEYDKRRHEQNL